MDVLILLDLINEFCHSEGRLSHKGYKAFIDDYNSISKINEIITHFSNRECNVIFCNLGFAHDYSNLKTKSQLLKTAQQNNVLQANTWSTQIFDKIEIPIEYNIVTKTSISGFESITSFINSNDSLFIAGLSTDLAVLATAFDIHDNNYSVTVFEQGCIAPSRQEHNNAISILQKFCTIA